MPTKIFFATPTHSHGVDPRHHAATHKLAALVRQQMEPLIPNDQLRLNLWTEPQDLPRVRSRMAWRFYKETDGTDLLFVDADIDFEPEVIVNMCRSGMPLIGCPYPRRTYDKDALKRGEHPYKYAHRLLNPHTETSFGPSIKVEGLGMGLTLIKRQVLDQMYEYYDKHGLAVIKADGTLVEKGLWFRDDQNNGMRTPALFLPALTDDEELFSEDYSFCNRYRHIGGQCWLYVGPGAPARHVGSFVYEGSMDGIIETRKPDDAQSDPPNQTVLEQSSEVR